MRDPVTPTPIQELKSELFDKKNITVFVKRDDLTHPEIMGNKWRKLKYNIQHALDIGVRTLVTYGGAYSNHIAATAAAARIFGLGSIGVIRGEELNPHSNPTLKVAHQNGMSFHFVTREHFRAYKKTMTVPFETDGSHMILPEGGSNELAIRGCAEIIDEIDIEFDIIATAAGTGGTLAGLIKGLGGRKSVLGFSALKGNWIQDDIKALLRKHDINHENHRIFEDFRFGGYGRFDLNLIQFILDFKQKFDILLDPIYTGKMFFSVWELTKNDQIASGSTLLLLHTGGLQGIAGFNHRFNLALPEP